MYYAIVEDGLRRVTMANVPGYSHVPVVVNPQGGPVG